MKIIYLPLEPYQERYTAQLRGWTLDRFRGLDVETIDGDLLNPAADGSPRAITTGVALDAAGRGHWALTQTARLMARLDRGDLGSEDIIYDQDIFHPGWEAVPYLLDQLPPDRRPRAYTHCRAQSVDVYDFTFPMRRWMRPFEQLSDHSHEGVFVATEFQRQLWTAANLGAARLHVVGLPFDRAEVQSRVPNIRSLDRRPWRVIFCSRFDAEKQPHFFMDVAEQLMQDRIEVLVTTSAPRLRSSEPGAVDRLRDLERHSTLLTVAEGLSKTDYYQLLAGSRVQLNTSLQDFISNTMNEASALGTPSVVPSFRAFPEVMTHAPQQMYRPWSVGDCCETITRTMVTPPPLDLIAVPAARADQTLSRVRAILTGDDPEIAAVLPARMPDDFPVEQPV